MTLAVGQLWAGHQPHGASLQQHEDKTHPSQSPGETEQIRCSNTKLTEPTSQLPVLTAEDSVS